MAETGGGAAPGGGDPASHREAARAKGARSYALGVFYIVLVACIWAGASVLVQFIYEDRGFDAPFFLTYTCTSLFSVYLPLWAGLRRLGWTRPTAMTPAFRSLTAEKRYRAEARASLPGERASLVRQRQGSEDDDDHDDSTPVVAVAPAAGATDENSLAATVVSQRSHIILALIVCPLWFLANSSYNVSLDLTSVTNSTIISTTSSIFTYIFGVVAGEERLHWLSVLGILSTFSGVVLTTLGDADDGATESVKGDFVCFFGAMMYGAYTTALKVYSPGDEDVSTSLMLGYMGTFNGVLLFPVVLLIALLHVEPLSKLTWEIFGLLVAKGILDNVLSDYLWMRAVLLTSPTVATVGLSLTVPIAFLTDFAFKSGVIPAQSAVWGSLFVVGGFVIVTTATPADVDKEGALLDDPPAVRKIRRFFARLCGSCNPETASELMVECTRREPGHRQPGRDMV